MSGVGIRKRAEWSETSGTLPYFVFIMRQRGGGKRHEKRQKLDVQICAGKHVYALDIVRDTQHTHLRACVCAHTHAQTHTNKP